jgi:hypothetical protein
MITNKRRMYGMVYRARRKGCDIVTRERTIYRAYYDANTPPLQQEKVLMREYGFRIQLKIE